MDEGERLRRNRLVFYEEDVGRIADVLQELLRLSGSKCAMLVDREGHMITKIGATSTFDDETVSALVAGSFAATREMAKLLGEEEFAVLFHQGRRDSIQLALVGERAILSIIFDDRTTAGMVRLYAAEATAQLGDILTEAVKRTASGKDAIPEALADSAVEALAEFFGAAGKDAGPEEEKEPPAPQE